MHRFPLALVLLLCSSIGAVQAFAPSASVSLLSKRSVTRTTDAAPTKKGANKPLFMAVLEDDDTSTLDALLRFGPAPAIIRITQPTKYWEAVDNFQQKEGCTRLQAIRNMDAYFTDPSGWIMSRDRMEKYGEVKEYGKSGIQKRPVFSTFWAIFVFWFFFSFLPTRIGELGGFHPSALEGGLCTPDISVVRNGKKEFECTKNIPLDELDAIYQERAVEKAQRYESAKARGFYD